MFTKTSQKQLIQEICCRFDDCDALLILQALKKMKNTELSSLLLVLPMHHANQLLVILPSDVSRRIVSDGFSTRKLSTEILQKLLTSIDQEKERAALLKEHTKRSQRTATTAPTEERKNTEASDSDSTVPTSVRILDTMFKMVGNSFKKVDH